MNIHYKHNSVIFGDSHSIYVIMFMVYICYSNSFITLWLWMLISNRLVEASCLPQWYQCIVLMFATRASPVSHMIMCAMVFTTKQKRSPPAHLCLGCLQQCSLSFTLLFVLGLQQHFYHHHPLLSHQVFFITVEKQILDPFFYIDGEKGSLTWSLTTQLGRISAVTILYTCWLLNPSSSFFFSWQSHASKVFDIYAHWLYLILPLFFFFCNSRKHGTWI